MKTAFWVCVAVYEIAVIVKWCVLPMIRRKARTVRKGYINYFINH